MKTNLLKVLLCKDMEICVPSPKLANSWVFTTLMGMQRIQVLVPDIFHVPVECTNDKITLVAFW